MRLDFYESQTCRVSLALRSSILSISRIPDIWSIYDLLYPISECKNSGVCRMLAGLHAAGWSFGSWVVVVVSRCGRAFSAAAC